MRYKKHSAVAEVRKKNTIKIIRTIFEIVFCCALLAVVVKNLFFQRKFIVPDKADWVYDTGFIALSYTGVSYGESDALISQSQLDSHLKALYDEGYVSVGIQDITDYYNRKGLLPQKAMLLMFEDGRKDSFIFAQPILEKYNFRAVMFTYASNINGDDQLFLNRRDIKYLEDSSYWDIGSSGYRFEYINVYKKAKSRSDNEGGNQDMLYNHYLMDYLRDEDGIPLESKREMQQRITWDYNEMNRIYNDVLGYQPRVYMIMHSNTLFNNMNTAVEEVNLKNIYKYYSIMFNRSGSCFNNYDSGKYNLSRLHVERQWSVNELLPRIDNDVRGR